MRNTCAGQQDSTDRVLISVYEVHIHTHTNTRKHTTNMLFHGVQYGKMGAHLLTAVSALQPVQLVPAKVVTLIPDMEPPFRTLPALLNC